MKRKMKLFMAFCAIVGIVGLACASHAAEPKIDLQTLFAKRVPILLEFGRGWCKPCKYMKPILDDMAKAYSGKVVVLTVDMDVNADLVRQFRIRMMPTQVFITPDGKEYLRNEGIMEREQIMQVFSRMGVPGPSKGAAPEQVPRRAGTR
ncbi:MAG: thioredoxin family protein [Thermodesulfobacteriota bacterium]